MNAKLYIYNLTNLGCVVGCAKNQFWGAVVSRANIRDIGLVLDEDFSTAKVAQLENPAVGVEQEILRLNVTVANALRVNVGQRSEELVGIQLDFQDGHGRLHLVEESRRSVNGFWNKFLDKVEVNFVFLEGS